MSRKLIFIKAITKTTPKYWKKLYEENLLILSLLKKIFFFIILVVLISSLFFLRGVYSADDLFSYIKTIFLICFLFYDIAINTNQINSLRRICVLYNFNTKLILLTQLLYQMVFVFISYPILVLILRVLRLSIDELQLLAILFAISIISYCITSAFCYFFSLRKNILFITISIFYTFITIIPFVSKIANIIPKYKYDIINTGFMNPILLEILNEPWSMINRTFKYTVVFLVIYLYMYKIINKQDLIIDKKDKKMFFRVFSNKDILKLFGESFLCFFTLILCKTDIVYIKELYPSINFLYIIWGLVFLLLNSRFILKDNHTPCLSIIYNIHLQNLVIKQYLIFGVTEIIRSVFAAILIFIVYKSFDLCVYLITLNYLLCTNSLGMKWGLRYSSTQSLVEEKDVWFNLIIIIIFKILMILSSTIVIKYFGILILTYISIVINILFFLINFSFYSKRILILEEREWVLSK